MICEVSTDFTVTSGDTKIPSKKAAVSAKVIWIHFSCFFISVLDVQVTSEIPTCKRHTFGEYINFHYKHNNSNYHVDLNMIL